MHLALEDGGRRLLVVIAADYDAAVRKGVDELFRQYDEDGFFSKVVLVSPYIRKDRRIALTDRIEYREFGWGRGRLGKALAPFHFLRLIAKCCQIVGREDINLIRATEPTLAGVVAWAVSRIKGVPYCISLHADYDQRYKLDGSLGAPTVFGSRTLIRPLERLTLSRAMRVLPIRTSLIPYLLTRGVRSDAVRVIPHGIDLAPFKEPPSVDIRCVFDLPQGKKILAFAGRLSAENYIDDMLDAVRILGEVRDDFLLVIAGGGVLEEKTAARVVSDPVLARVVRMVGFINRETVCALRQECHVSLCLMGGFSLIEACAGGRPVVAYGVEWHHELVIDGETGRLIAEHDVSGVADAIASLLDHPEECGRMGAKGRDLAFARHDIHGATAVKQRWYAEMLER